MMNAEKFKQAFGIYATELWSMSEEDFLAWLNVEAKTEEAWQEKPEPFQGDKNDSI